MNAENAAGNEYLSTGVKVRDATQRELVQEGDRLRKIANELLAEQKQTGKDLSAEVLAAHNRSQELYRLAFSTPNNQ